MADGGDAEKRAEKKVAIKIVPIDGDFEVNETAQKSAQVSGWGAWHPAAPIDCSSFCCSSSD